MARPRTSPPLAKYAEGLYNLKALYRQSDFMDRQLGRNYFPDFYHRIVTVAARSGCLVAQTACAVYAVLSPNNSEESCMDDMARAVYCYKDGSAESLQERWDKLAVHTYGANKAKARRILSGEDPDLVIRGPKVMSFYHNILEPYNRQYVTIDGHMVCAWNNKRLPLDSAGISESGYWELVRGVREVADSMDLVPCAFQATLWLAWRRIHKILYKPQYRLPFDNGLGL